MARFSDELTNEIRGTVLLEEVMSNHTTWRIGGAAEALVIPKSAEDVICALEVALKWNKEVTIIGNGSNMLVSDSGIRGLVLKFAGGLTDWAVEGNILSAESGCPLPLLSRRTAAMGLSGLEFAAGIPATLGGAIAMNSGAYGTEIGKLILAVQACNYQGEKKTLTHQECKFSYRSSMFNNGLIILKAELTLEQGDSANSLKLIEDYVQKRTAVQPLDYPNAGSVFRNPDGYVAARLIEEAGLKGLKIGGAMVSPKHANFIVNVGGATAREVLTLIELVTEKVYGCFRIELHPEIRFVGKLQR